MKKVLNWLFTNYKNEKVGFSGFLISVLLIIILLGLIIFTLENA